MKSLVTGVFAIVVQWEKQYCTEPEDTPNVFACWSILFKFMAHAMNPLLQEMIARDQRHL